MKKNLNILFLLITFLVLFNFGCDELFVEFDADVINAVKSGNPDKCLELDADYKKEDCLSQIAEKKGNLEICDQITTESRKWSCYSQIAENKKDSDICAKITNVESGDYCKARVANKLNDQVLCAKITNENLRDGCLSQVAINKDYEAICKDIKDKYRQDECYSGIAVNRKNSELCGSMNDVYRKDSCYYNIAQAADKYSDCFGIHEKSVEKRMDCFSYFAVKNKDEKLCENVPTEGGWRDGCYRDASKTIGKEEVCNKIVGYMSKDECFTNVAIANKDVKYCEKNSYNMIDFCKKQTALYTQTVSFCDEIKDSTAKPECFSEVAIAKKDISVCAKVVGNNDEAYSCYYYFAEGAKDASLCMGITAAGTKEKCIHNLAVNTKDEKVCVKITDAALKKQCIASTGLTQVQK